MHNVTLSAAKCVFTLMHNVIFWGADVVFNSIIHCKLGIIIDQGEQLRTRTGRRGGGGGGEGRKSKCGERRSEEEMRKF